MANKINLSVQGQIVRNGGPIKDSVYKGDGASTWVAGQLLRINSSGQLVACSAGAAAGVHCIALSTVSSAASNTTFYPVQMITDKTEFEVQVFHTTAASALPAATNIGDQFDYIIGTGAAQDDGSDASATGVIGVNLASTAAPVWEITDVGAQYDRNSNAATDQHGFVKAKILASQITTAPA